MRLITDIRPTRALDTIQLTVTPAVKYEGDKREFLAGRRCTITHKDFTGISLEAWSLLLARINEMAQEIDAEQNQKGIISC